ncbi:hypothetical protein F9278_13135 [Streptomyces phaeolivaceus]|uniref:FXSXX-COOH protein n=1 Tax=Streptomyces phaeolivaceus TaxID=2653200 RepID=A0A5P8K2Z7_9ACTN|nr:hypothetical protein [Streptomyces phaeolivaceus]QFQ96997.1 hypothetical protein F9278_13135 [Streptomyces phaeolivaceus]
MAQSWHHHLGRSDETPMALLGSRPTPGPRIERTARTSRVSLGAIDASDPRVQRSTGRVTDVPERRSTPSVRFDSSL